MARVLRTKVQIALWVGSVAMIIAIGLYYFPHEYNYTGFWKTLYCTLRLFVFEHDFPTFPKSWPLILIYFMAPLITISAIGTAISYLFRLPPTVRTRWMSDHVIVCGVGNIGKLLTTTLKKKGVPVVGMDLGPSENFEEWSSEHSVPMIYGDFNSRALLERAGAVRARAIIFASGSDLANLEAVMGAYDLLRTYSGPVRLLWAHIANEKLGDTARLAVLTKGSVGIRFFDTYRIAASKMVVKYFSREIRQRVSEITILGFGKFGRDLMEVLVRDVGPDENWAIRVVDIRDLENEVRSLAKDFNICDRVTFTKAAIQDLHLLDGEDRAFFLCTDDDIGNLTAAMMLAKKMNCTHIYVRMSTWPMPTIADHLGEDHGIIFVNINDLVVQGIEDLPGIFEPAKPSDLKA